MNRKILAAIAAMMFAGIALATVSCKNQQKQDKQEQETVTEQTKSNGVFEIISCSSDSVKFTTVAETKFYSLALVSGDQTVEAKMFSNSVDTVQWFNGARFWPGSTMRLPALSGYDAMTLPSGIVMTIFDFDVPENFKAEKIRFVTEGTEEMFYDISKSSWDK